MDPVLETLENYRLTATDEQKQSDLEQLESVCQSEVAPLDLKDKITMTIVETTIDYPVYVLNEERYQYYRNCDKKSKAVDSQIKEEAKNLFNEWKDKTAHQILVEIKDPFNVANTGTENSVETLLGDEMMTITDFNDPTITFNSRLAKYFSDYANDAFAEHREYFDKRLRKALKNHFRQLKFYKILTCVFAFLTLFLGFAWLLGL